MPVACTYTTQKGCGGGLVLTLLSSSGDKVAGLPTKTRNQVFVQACDFSYAGKGGIQF